MDKQVYTMLVEFKRAFNEGYDAFLNDGKYDLEGEMLNPYDALTNAHLCAAWYNGYEEAASSYDQIV
jgi:hypothetical protein